MDFLTSSVFWVSLAQIMMINILLSGDNAVVIAMASRALPAKQQKHAILFGSFGAIVLRILLTFFAVALLSLPYLKIIGAILLCWIGIKLLVPDESEAELDGHSNLWAAIKTIIVADLVMSLDNVLGVAAAAKGDTVLLIVGLALSIPLIIYGSKVVLGLMNRFPAIVTAGGALLGWVAGEMFISDPAVSGWINEQAAWMHNAAPTLSMGVVVSVGKWLAASPSGEGTMVLDMLRHEEEVAREQAPAAADEDPLPTGYRWASRPWRTLPDGRREYPQTQGLTSFRVLTPVSSHLRHKD